MPCDYDKVDKWMTKYLNHNSQDDNCQCKKCFDKWRAQDNNLLCSHCIGEYIKNTVINKDLNPVPTSINNN